MSQETRAWLNTQVLVGFMESRGTAWHYDESAQGAESNHYTGPVPVADVERRLFNWQPVTSPLYVPVLDGSGFEEVEGRQAVRRSDTGAVLGTFTNRYTTHELSKWLLRNVSTILQDGLSIGSAGLLKGGAVAWVQVEMPESRHDANSGAIYRPNLIAFTSMDGSLATGYKRTVTMTVCDNTLAAGLSENGQVIKFKHTSGGVERFTDAREALNILELSGDAFSEELATLTAEPVNEARWDRFLTATIPMPEEKGRARTMAENKRDAMTGLWLGDDRVSPWHGTAFGVVQAVNTYEHHISTVRGAQRQERNMLNALKGAYDTLDASTLRTLATV